MNSHKPYALCHILLVSLFCLISTTAVAAEQNHSLKFKIVTNSDGLMTNEPLISQDDLNDALIENKYLLNVQTNKLSTYITENDITTQTNLMAAIIPGGLIYLAWRKTQLNTASEKLAVLRIDANELHADVLALHVMTNTILVARFP